MAATSPVPIAIIGGGIFVKEQHLVCTHRVFPYTSGNTNRYLTALFFLLPLARCTRHTISLPQDHLLSLFEVGAVNL